MTKARELAELGTTLSVDGSGNADLAGILTTDGLTVDGSNATANFGSNVVIQAANNVLSMADNAYFDGSWKYKTTAAASTITSYRGNDVLRVRSAASGTANTAITWSDKFKVEANGDVSFYEDTGTTAKLFWDASAESLGIGTSSPTNVKLQLNGSLSGTAGTGHLAFGEASTPLWNWRLDTTTADLMLDRSYGGWQSTPVIAFDRSSGNVGIGTSSPSRKLQVFDVGSSLVADFRSASGNNSYASFSNNASTADQVKIGSSSGDLTLFTNYSERLRIDASGNVLVGMTTTPAVNGWATEGFAYINGDYMAVTRDQNITAYFNRTTSDGDIVAFRKDGTTVGSIGNSGSGVEFSSPDTVRVHASNGVRLYDNVDGGIILASSRVYPSNPSGSTNDATISLGSSTARFKDLYLSGGVYLGGTTSSNYLDDYEFGSWTPTLARSVSDPTVTYTVRNGYYYKVGNVVFLRANIVASSVSGGSGSPEITGLPFTPNHTYSYGYSNHGVSSMSYGLLSTTGGYPPVMFARGDSSTRITVVDSNAQGLTGWDASGRLDFAITYTTNS